jgi:hypothetical protein
MKMKIYTYIYMYRWLPHNAIQGCILSVYEYNRLPRPDLRWDLFIYCVVRLFSHFRSCTTFNKVENNELIVHDIVNIYIGREVQRWTRKGMYQKQCSWMDYFCALVLIWEAKVVYMYISFWQCLYIVFIAKYFLINSVFFLGFIPVNIYIHVSVVAPPQVVFCFKEIRKLPQEDHQTCDAKSLYQFWHCKCHFAFNKYLNY